MNVQVGRLNNVQMCGLKIEDLRLKCSNVDKSHENTLIAITKIHSVTLTSFTAQKNR
jgi:hypothetical protein